MIPRRFAIGILLLVVTLGTGRAAAEVIARCGKGYLERIDGALVLHLKGSPREMGYQHGALLRDQVRSLVHQLLVVRSKDATVEAFGLKLTPNQVLGRIFDFQRPHIPSRFIEEMRGVAEGAEIPERDVFIANSIPELFHCSGFALLEAITSAGSVLHGRVLDYGIDWKLQDHAVLVVAEPDGKIPFVNVTYAAFIGSVSGMNQQAVSIGEMGGRGEGKWAGTPMALLVRRVLEEAGSLDEAVATFKNAKRTCEYYFVIADGKQNSAVGMEASADNFFVVRPGEAHAKLPTPVPDAVLMSADQRYVCLCKLVDQATKRKEKFSVERAIRLMDSPVAMKSNLHNVLFAPRLGKLWVAHASTDRKPAWSQKYREFDLLKLLAQSPPQGGKELPFPKVIAQKP